METSYLRQAVVIACDTHEDGTAAAYTIELRDAEQVFRILKEVLAEKDADTLK